MNNVSMNFHIQVFVQTYALMSLGYVPRNGLFGFYGSLMFLQDLLIHGFNSCIQEAETGGARGVQGQPDKHSKSRPVTATLSDAVSKLFFFFFF